MRCRDARRLLSARLDDELAPDDGPRLERHLDGCADCRAVRDEYESLRARLRISEPIAVDLVPALRERLAGTPAPAMVTLDSNPPQRARTGRVLVAAAAAVIVAIGTVAFVTQKDTRVVVSTDRDGNRSVTPTLRAPDGAALLLAWTSGGLPDDAVDTTRALVGVTGVTEVRGSELRLTGATDANGAERLSLPPGAAVPVDALAIDTAGYSRDLPAATARIVRRLPRDGALLGTTSARLRGIGAGGSLTFGSTTIRVTAVVADSLVGGAEVVVRDDSPLDIRTPRFLLVAYRGDRSEIETAIGNALRRQVRFRAPGETPYLRHGDAVLPLALVKARFGEFWYRTDARGVVTIDSDWVERNIVAIDVPGIGRLRCHRFVAAELRRVLTGVTPKTAAPAIAFDPQIASPTLGLSRHAWGIGLTLPPVAKDEARTRAKLAGVGFTWGGLWLNRSANYYEWIGP